LIERATLDQTAFKKILRRNLIVPLVVSVILAAVFVGQILYLLSTTKWVSHANEVISQANDLLRTCIDMQTSARGYAITENPDYLYTYEHARNSLAGKFTSLEQLISDNPAQTRRLRVISVSAKDVADYYGRVVKLPAEQMRKAFIDGHERQLVEDLRNFFDEFVNSELQLRGRRIDDTRASTYFILTFGILLTFVIGALVGIFGRDQLLELSKNYSELFLRLERSNRNLEMKIKEREQALGIRDEFLTIASHELRTPITSLRLQLQHAMRKIDRHAHLSDAEIRNVFAVSDRQINRLIRLIEDLVDVSRIQSGRLALHFAPTDMGEIIDEVLKQYEDDLKESHCRLKKFIDPHVDGLWDADRIEQLAASLISNAIKYARASTISVTVKSEGDKALLKVEDTGPGISKENQEKIFSRFERGSASRDYGGLGLGLFIAQNIAMAHGGSIHVESAVGRGTSFSVEIPKRAVFAAEPVGRPESAKLDRPGLDHPDLVFN
jgi:signal transduction histidine kinase